MSRRSLDTQIITVRQVNALTNSNTLIPALTTLTSDGMGGTYWAVPSSLGGIPGYNTIVVDNANFPATSPSNTFYISTAAGIGTVSDPAKNLVTFYSKCFDTFDISGGNKVTSYANSVVSPTVNFAGRNGVKITGDPYTRTIFFDTQVTAISTGIYGYSKFNVISNASTLKVDAVNNSNNIVLTAGSTSSVMNFIGLGDIVLNGHTTSNAVFIGISSFSSSNYLNISSLAYKTYGSTLSTVSSLFCDVKFLNEQISSVSTYSISTLLSTSVGFDSRQLRNENNVKDNYTEINLYKLLSTSVQSYIDSNVTLFGTIQNNIGNIMSFSSSINTEAYVGNYTGTVETNQHFTVRTVQFRLDSMSTMIDTHSQVVVSYSPSLLYNFNMNASELGTISTFLVAGNTTIRDATFVRPWYLPITSGTVAPYLYTDNMEFVIQSSNIAKALDSTFMIYHHIDLDYVTYANNGTLVVNKTHGKNSLNIRLTGMN